MSVDLALSRPVSQALATLVSKGALASDPLQQQAAGVLDRIADDLTQKPNGILSGLFGKSRTVRGAYLVGQVGRGKTMLMDLFFETVPEPRKRRVHFHEFMDEMHEAIRAFRASPRGKSESADPIAAVTRPLLAEIKLLCLDEFQVTDITNAMLLGRLFGMLFAGGVTVVATSNVVPDGLYEHGLNRQLILPFIAELKRNVDVVPLDGPTDYRRLKFEGQDVYQFGTGPEVKAAMDRLWLRLTGGEPGAPTELHSLGRAIPVPLAAMGAARFSFADLCEKPLGARDYVRLSHAYDTLMLDGVPQFSRLRSDAAKRFILLVDTLYDRGVKLAASFAVPLDHLGQDDRTRFEFQRTVSRLIEMQSVDYLAAPHKAAEPA
ncbi:MAG TPA: cell division protein ZapE [Devosia sp.]